MKELVNEGEEGGTENNNDDAMKIEKKPLEEVDLSNGVNKHVEQVTIEVDAGMM